jgi:hypothetical protein
MCARNADASHSTPVRARTLRLHATAGPDGAVPAGMRSERRPGAEARPKNAWAIQLAALPFARPGRSRGTGGAERRAGVTNSSDSSWSHKLRCQGMSATGVSTAPHEEAGRRWRGGGGGRGGEAEVCERRRTAWRSERRRHGRKSFLMVVWCDGLLA